MPGPLLAIWRRNFAPKKARPRKWPSVSMVHRDMDTDEPDPGPDVGPILLRLGAITATFIHGRWVAGGVTEDALTGGAVAAGPGFGGGQLGGFGGAGGSGQLAEENQMLREENNMLKLKVELLLDMLADQSSDGQRPDLDDWERQERRGARCRHGCEY